jgi:hypothetical protein
MESTMTDETHLRDKPRKIEALFAGAATPGKRQPAGAAPNGFGCYWRRQQV